MGFWKICFQTLICLALVIGIAGVNLAGDVPCSGEKILLKQKEDKNMSNEKNLENLIAQGDWGAVEKTRRMSEDAWPAVKRGAQMPDFLSRQIAMACAGILGGEEAEKLLLAGLNDKHINVSLAAAGQLSVNPPAGALDDIIKELASGHEENIRELLVLALGRIPDETSTKALIKIEKEDEDLAPSARLALARHRQGEFLEAHVERLESETPHIRYEALSQMIYIDDPDLAGHAKKLLSDKAEAVNIGNQYKPLYRRVCDQAVDTLAALLNITPPFETGNGIIYTNDQLYQIQNLVK